MNRGELLRRRRCRLLQLAMVFGVALVVFTRTWPSLVVAAVGEALLAVAWYRECRGRGGEPPPA